MCKGLGPAFVLLVLVLLGLLLLMLIGVDTTLSLLTTPTLNSLLLALTGPLIVTGGDYVQL
jgi:hypothetical protein